jgi:rhodanese-related sulfurtransferase
MKRVALYILLIFALPVNSQESLSELLKQYNKRSVPYISIQELAMPKTDAVILDARERSEFIVSHIKNAIHVGYNNFQLDSVQHKIPDINAYIVVYCSLGIRSEDIAEKLKSAGYTNVSNLYGGIFEWKNNDFKVYNSEEQETDKIHVGHEFWGKWLRKGEKVYE